MAAVLAVLQEAPDDGGLRGCRLGRVGERHLQVRRRVERPAEPEQLLLGGIQRPVGLGHREGRLVGELLEGEDEVEVGRPATVDRHEHDVDGELADLAAQHLAHEAVADRVRLARVGQRAAQLHLALEQARDGEELAGQLGEARVLPAGVEALLAGREALAAGSEHQLALPCACRSRSAMKSSTV